MENVCISIEFEDVSSNHGLCLDIVYANNEGKRNIDMLHLFVCLNNNPARSNHVFLLTSQLTHHLPLCCDRSDELYLHIHGLHYVKNFYECFLGGNVKFTGSMLKQSKPTLKVFLTESSTENFIVSNSHPSFEFDLTHYPVSMYKIKSTKMLTVAGQSRLIFVKQLPNIYRLFVHKKCILDDVLPVDLEPAKYHQVQIHHISQLSEDPWYSLHITNEISFTYNFKSYLTPDKLHLLYDKCLTFKNKRNKKFATILYLYRNKPEWYFQNIFQNFNGIMIPYMKDYNGDQCSVINGNIDGLFFSASVDSATLYPPLFSYFGPWRLLIKSDTLFRKNSNLYFADFYCHYHAHYVTLVLTSPGSNADSFCRERLLKLNNRNNPFLQLHFDKVTGTYFVKTTLSIHVEVLYTECIDIPKVLRINEGFFTTVELRGRGQSTLKGIPKNPNCLDCNLD